MTRIAVLASGEGTNLEAILEAVERGTIAGKVVLVLSDREEANALNRAKKHHVNALFVDPGQYTQREDYDRALIGELKNAQVDLVVLAGYMRLLSPLFIQAYPLQIINIHPSLLPAFSGLDGVKQVFDYGVKVTGCTVHFVDEGLDSGPVILQEAVPIIQHDSHETLCQRIHAVEHRIYPIAINLFCQGKLKVEGRRCLIVEAS